MTMRVPADELLDHVESVLDLLGRSPLLGRSRDDLAAGFRSFAVGNYVIFYFLAAAELQRFAF